jgi:hypothetical protein
VCDKEDGMVRTQIQLTTEQAQTLKSLASKQGVSMAELIRRSIDRYLLSEQQPDRRLIRERALSMAGKYASGQNDIGERHDDYLSAAYGEVDQ